LYIQSRRARERDGEEEKGKEERREHMKRTERTGLLSEPT
jgi:hypothetical protein